MAHPISEAPKSSGWVAVRVGAVVLCALQGRDAATFFAERQALPALLIMLCVVAGVVMAMISLIHPSYEIAPGAMPDTSTRTLVRFDYKVSFAYALFFLSAALSGLFRSWDFRVLSAAVGLLGFAVALALGIRDLRRLRHAPA